LGVGRAVSPEASPEVGLLWLVPPEAAALAILWLLLFNSQLVHVFFCDSALKQNLMQPSSAAGSSCRTSNTTDIITLIGSEFLISRAILKSASIRQTAMIVS
jgi:hypothetical protein